MTLQTTIENRGTSDEQVQLTGRIVDTADRELARLAPTAQTLKPGFNTVTIPVKLVALAQGVRVVAEIELSKGKLLLDRRSIDWSAEQFCRQHDYLFEYYMDVDFQMRDIGASGCVTISADEGTTSLGLSPHPWIDSLPTGEVMGIMSPADALTRASTQERAAKNLAKSLRAYRPYQPSTVIIQDEWSHAFRPAQADANLPYFRDYLRGRYANDIQRLNKSWGTSLASFDQVTLEMCSTETIQKSSAPPTRWADLYRASEIAASDYIQLMSKAAKEAVPGAAVGLSGTQDSTATGGLDWWRIMQTSGSSYTYGGSSVRQIQSFAQPGTKLFRWSYPTLSNTLRAARDPWRDMFDGCAGYVHYGGGYSELFGPDYRPHPVAPVVQQQITEIRSGPARLLRGARLEDFDIATLYSPNSYRAWRYLNMTRGVAEFINDELISISKAMVDQRMNDTVVSYRQLETGEVTLPRYRALFLPGAAAMSDAEVQGVKKFVEAGGLVIADVRPGMFDENCKERSTGPLDEVFGIAPATSAPTLKTATLTSPEEFGITNKITVRAGETDLRLGSDATALTTVQIDQSQAPALVTHRFGKGTAVLLNFACPDYCRYRGGGYGGEVEIITQSASARGFDVLLASLLRKQRDIQPCGDVLDTQGRRAPVDRLYTYQDGAAWYFAFLMPSGPNGEAQSNGIFKATKEGWVYDVRKHQLLGRAGSVPMTMNFAQGAVLAVLPYEVDRLSLKAPARATVGSSVELQLRVTAKSGDVGRHVLAITLVRPDGSIQDCDRFTVDAPAGVATARWSSALNDPTGVWKVRAIDAISGQSQEAPLELIKP
jgi:hypothetical protein